MKVCEHAIAADFDYKEVVRGFRDAVIHQAFDDWVTGSTFNGTDTGAILHPYRTVLRLCLEVGTELAKRVLADIEAHNHGVMLSGVYFLCACAAPEGTVTATPERFGYCLGMEFLGTGIAWSDDHANHPLVVPYGECCIYASFPDSEGQLSMNQHILDFSIPWEA